MKKTLSINLKGLVFTIDEDAYEKLQIYLQDINKHFQSEDDIEIISDIETRIAELFTELLNNKRVVVTIEDVDYVIQTLGSPDQFDDDEENKDAETPDNGKKEKQKHKKFYRDTDNQIFGGVAAGLAAYTGIDVTIIRILFIILTFVSFSWMIVIYIILWVICPSAKTTSQKLEMRGIEPSIENIKNFNSNIDLQNNSNTIGSGLGNFIKICFKIFAIIIGIVLCLTFIGMLGLIFVISISLLTMNPIIPGFEISTFYSVLFIISLFASIILPILMIIVSIIQLLKKNKFKHNKFISFLCISGILWVIFVSVLLFIIFKFDFPRENIHNIKNTYINSNTYTEERLSDFTIKSLDVSTGVNVCLQNDTCNYVEISGDEMFLRNIELDTAGNKLSISYSSSTNNLFNTNTVIVHHTNSIKEITVSSSGSVYSDSILKSDKLTLNANSAGSIDLTLDCDSLFVNASSAADIDLCGKTNYSKIDASSAAEINAKQLHCTNSVISSSSVAEIEINSDTIDISSSSMGKIKHDKNAKIKRLDTSSKEDTSTY